MAERTQMKYHKPSESSRQYEYDEKEAAESMAKDATKQKAQRKAGELATKELTDIDEILEEIDGILDTNNQTVAEFVIDFRQKGGQ